jgi:thiol-disulfide isomerase/thioredoxin
MKKIFFFIILIGIGFWSCNKTQTAENESETVAVVGNEKISITEIDNQVKQELYDELSRIYTIRKLVLNETIKEKLLLQEAQKLGIGKDELLKRNYERCKNKLAAFKKVNKFEESVPVFERGLERVSLGTEKGQKILNDKFNQYITDILTDSLKKVYSVKISLTPPLSPFINLDNLLTHFRGNPNSKVTFLIVSDFECSACKDSHSIFTDFYKKYKDKVRFGFTTFAPYVSVSAIAAECADNQGKFWEMHDSIFSKSKLLNKAELFAIAKNLKLDMKKFEIDFNSKAIADKLQNNIRLLDSYGIYGTPTIIINNRLIFNSKSLDEIEEMLKRVLMDNANQESKILVK